MHKSVIYGINVRVEITVAVAGASGYAGGELLRLILGHPELSLGAVCAGANAGRRITELHPALSSLDARLFAATDAAALGAADLVFLALPHGESSAIVAELDLGTRVVDLGADFRLVDPAAWRHYYSGPHAGSWTYGLPELSGARAAIQDGHRVANPGCYATSVALGLAPLLAAGLVAADDVVIVAASGTSGAGRKATDALLASGVMGAMSAYKVGGVHQHTPEMEQTLSAAAGAPVTLSFTPLLAPMPRGILATCTARLSPGVPTAELTACLVRAYADEFFVQVAADGRPPTTKSVTGSNGASLAVVADEHAGRAVVTVAIDNLGKGAAGQAIQNANLMLGLVETSGLTSMGIAP